MASLEERLIAGLEAQEWRETATRGPWRRFGKWGRGAMYVLIPGPINQRYVELDGYLNLLWFSELHRVDPEFPVVGPIRAQIIEAGDKHLAQQAVDTQGLLIELLYTGPNPNGGSK